MSTLVRLPVAAALCTAAFILQGTPSHAQVTVTPVALPGYTVSQWVGPSSAYTNPDSIVSDGTHIWIGYQNVTAKDGSDNKTSTVVEYTAAGSVMATYPVPGHNDGLRIDPATGLVWASSNEDGNPAFVTIDPASGKITPYTFPMPTPHGGGYDDMAFAGGSAFIAASNPTLNTAGVNTAPAVDKMSLANGQIALTPVLQGNASATDTTANNATVTLNEVDPDSMNVDPQGDVVLDNQAGAELVFLHNAGTSSQTVSRVPLGTQIDDFAWAPSQASSLFIVDAKNNTIWKMSGTFAPNTLFAEAPSDSGVAGFVGTIDLSSGTISPVAIGFGSPTGLAFIPATGSGGSPPLSATLAAPQVSQGWGSHLFPL
jgi:hypothetical protein